MVETAGATDGPGALRPLNAPVPVHVKATANGRPLQVVLGRKRLTVASVEDAWRVEDEWWRDQPVLRTYFEAVLEDGRKVTLFLDMAGEDAAGGQWYAQNYA